MSETFTLTIADVELQVEAIVESDLFYPEKRESLHIDILTVWTYTYYDVDQQNIKPLLSDRTLALIDRGIRRQLDQRRIDAQKGI